MKNVPFAEKGRINGVKVTDKACTEKTLIIAKHTRAVLKRSLRLYTKTIGKVHGEQEPTFQRF